MSLVLALLAGIGVGGVLGLLGAGGSILAVPVLIGLLDHTAHQATAASLVVVSVAAFSGVGDQIRRGTVRWRTAFVFALAGFPGSILGSIWNHAVSDQVLVVSLAVIILAVAVLTWVRSTHPAEDLPEISGPFWRTCGLSAIVGFGIGILTGFFGVGGGFLIMPALLMLIHLPVRDAVGTSMLIIGLISSIALAVHLYQGDNVRWSVVVPFAGATLIGALLGSRVGARFNPATLLRLFAAFLVVVAAMLLVLGR